MRTPAKRPTAAELDAMNEFIQLVQSGHAPKVDAFVKRHPDEAGHLRPVLRTMMVLRREFRKCARGIPDADLEAMTK